MKLRVFSSYIVIVLLLAGCKSTKFVPDGEFLLNKATIKCDAKDITKDELKQYLRQTPNAAVFPSIFGGLRMQLGVYNLAPKDTTHWFSRFGNKVFRRIGDPPVIFSPSLTLLSVQQIQKGLENRGYIHAKVESKIQTKRKKVNVEYVVKCDVPYRVRDYAIALKNTDLIQIASDTSKSLIRPNMLFDTDILNAERERISARFRELGYYNFTKEYLSYNADSSLNQHKVDVSLDLRDYLKRSADSINKTVFKQYTIQKVVFRINKNASLITAGSVPDEQLDSVRFRDFYLVTPKERIIKLDALVQNTFINPKTLYSDQAVERTYQALNSLGPIKYVNINFKEVANNMLECDILITPTNVVSLSTEAEGTYTDGYWGGAGNINFVHRNPFKGAETLSFTVRGAFEKQDSIWANELGVQLALRIPRFMLPVGSYDFKRNIHANTEFNSAFSYQNRPGEFKTTSAGAGIGYSWNRQQYHHNLQLLELNYVQFPYISPAFRSSFLTTGYYNPNNYEDHFIMRLGYSCSYSNFNANRPMQNYSTVRYSIESAGNTLYGLSKILGNEKKNDAYTLFKVRFAQYIKGEYNITRHEIINNENRFVSHFGLGIGVPYGNSEVIPYEKRFFSGGANSVRGWSESTLGPGVYKRITGRARDFNQVGDIKLDMNMEYRTKLFSIFDGALFLDAGNVWTINNYTETLNTGVFKFDSFLPQIAIAYGMGIRLDVSFFILRFDFGAKLYDPVLSRTQRWRIHPKLSDDYAVHIAIGYPF